MSGDCWPGIDDLTGVRPDMLRSPMTWTCDPRRSRGASGYGVEPRYDGLFAVFSPLGLVVFAGTLRECSEWLDGRELDGRETGGGVLPVSCPPPHVTADVRRD